MGRKKELKRLQETFFCQLEAMSRMEEQKRIHFMNAVIHLVDCYYEDGPPGVFITKSRAGLTIFSLNTAPKDILELTAGANEAVSNKGVPPPPVMQ